MPHKFIFLCLFGFAMGQYCRQSLAKGVGLGKNVRRWFKPSARYGIMGTPNTPHDQVQPWENIKTHSPRYPKNTFSEVFHIKLRFLNVISDGLNGININSLI